MIKNALKVEELKSGLNTAFVDGCWRSNNECTPSLIYNDPKKGIKVSTELIDEIKTCDEYYISVAFITNSNLLADLKGYLKEADEMGKRGKIITTDMNNFTDPDAIESLRMLKNLEIKMYRSKKSNTGFHTKGYIFKHGDFYHIIVGSSNFTENALTKQKEWNTKLISSCDGEYAKRIIDQFFDLWNDKNSEYYENFINQYKYEYNQEKIKKSVIDKIIKQFSLNDKHSEIKTILMQKKTKAGIIDSIKAFLSKDLNASIDVEKIINAVNSIFNDVTSDSIIHKQKKIAQNKKIVNYHEYNLQPNEMQKAFVSNTIDFINAGKTKALLISATGTGKTYASAFLARELCCNKLLFISHSERINAQAMEAYKDVFEDTRDMSLLSGNTIDINKCLESDFIFATIQMLSKEKVFSNVQKNEFDLIIIDEAHHINGNDSSCYNKVLSYFIPNKLLLGMTATPERMDSFNIFDVFDHNISYEIRLQEALEKGYLCPFHYYALSDMLVDGKSVDDSTNFNSLSYINRVKHIINESKYFGYSGTRLKGLIFCSRNAECNMIAEIINGIEYDDNRRYRAVSLGNGGNVADILDRLENDEREDFIDFVISVDKIGEGIDVKSINQIIMLRPTEIEYFSKKFLAGKRINEIFLFEEMVNNNNFDFNVSLKKLNKEYNVIVNCIVKKNLYNLFTNNFNISSEHEKYKDVILLDNIKDKTIISNRFKDALRDIDFKNILNEMIIFSKNRYNKFYDCRYENLDFVLNKKYTYEEVCRLLNWSKNIVANSIGGYYFEKETNTYPIFINYHKSKNINESINYNDRFVNNSHIITMSKSNRNINSNDVQNMINAKKNETDVLLFVKNNKDDNCSKEFYFLGKMELCDVPKQSEIKKEVELSWSLKTPVSKDIYDYIVLTGGYNE